MPRPPKDPRAQVRTLASRGKAEALDNLDFWEGVLRTLGDKPVSPRRKRRKNRAKRGRPPGKKARKKK